MTGKRKSDLMNVKCVLLFLSMIVTSVEGGVLPEVMTSIGCSDHRSFWQESYPALIVTDTANFRYPYYHTPEDTVDKIDFERMARVVRGLQAVIAEVGP